MEFDARTRTGQERGGLLWTAGCPTTQCDDAQIAALIQPTIRMNDPHEDPLVATSRREAAVVLTLFIAAMSYTVGYCAWHGYNRTLDELTFVLGFPDWVFWGIVVPWGVCTILGWLLSAFYIANTPLEPAAPPPGAANEENPVDV